MKQAELELRTLSNCGSEPEAACALETALAIQGVPCVLTPIGISNVYSTREGFVVHVANCNWDAAQAVLGARSGNGVDWVCAACQAENDAGFDVCWQCGQERLESAVMAKISGTPEAAQACEPRVTSDEVSPVNADCEDLQRAWKAAIVGAMIPIGLASVYSMGLLLRVNVNLVPNSERWKFVAAWLLNVVVLLIFLGLLKRF